MLQQLCAGALFGDILKHAAEALDPVADVVAQFGHTADLRGGHHVVAADLHVFPNALLREQHHAQTLIGVFLGLIDEVHERAGLLLEVVREDVVYAQTGIYSIH